MVRRWCLALMAATGAAFADEKKPTFEDDVLPIFRNHCLGCHNTGKARADLDLSTYQGVMNGSSGGQVISAGDSGASKLYLVTAHQAEPKMPPKSGRIPDEELAVLKAWIDAGLLEKAGSKPKLPDKPKMNLSLGAASVGKPKDPVAMPADLLLEPVVRTAKPGLTNALAANPWAPLFAVAGQKQVLLYHADTAELLGVLPFPEGAIHVLKFSRNGDLLLAGGGIGGKSGKVVVWKVSSGQRVIEVGNEHDAVLAADISSDQSQIALGGPGKLVKIYSTKDGELIHSIKKHTDWVQALEFSPDAVLLASGDRAGNVHVWESMSGNEFYALRGHTGAINDLAWRDDSNVLATASEDTTIRLWEMENGGQIKSWGAHGGGVQSVRFAHNGHLVSCGRDRVAKLWDPNGAQKIQFEAFGDLALRVAISHDDQRVLAGDWSGDLRLYLAADGKRLANLKINPPTLAERIDENAKVLAALEPPAAKALEEFRAKDAVRATLANDVAGLQAQAKAAADAAAKMEAEIAPLQQKEQAAKAEVAKFETAMTETAKKHAEAEEAARKARAAADALAAELQKTKQSLAEQQAALAETQKKIAPLVESMAKSKAAATETAAQAAKKAEEAKAAAQRSAEAKAAADKANAELLAARKKAAELKAAKINVGLHAARAELAAVESQHRELTRAADEEKAAADKLVAELEALKSFMAEGPKLTEAKQAEAVKAKAALDGAAKAVADSEAVVNQKKSLHAAAGQTAAAIAAAAAAAKDNAPLAQSAAKAKEAVDLLAADLDAATKALAAKVEERKKAEGPAAAAAAAVEELKADLAAGPKRAEALTASIAEAKAKHAVAVAKAEEFAKAALAAAKAKVDQLAAEYAQAKSPPQTTLAQ